ncbi:MAG: hypothetical protein ACYTFA_18830, partial [Planctomycetota bacterium]
PRRPGDPVQAFPTDMFRLEGELFGDPDFCTLRVTGGAYFGLPPSTGQATITDIGGGLYHIDSFFDITYQIEFEGCPASPIEDYMGTTTATIRMETGNDLPTCAGGCDQGYVCHRTITGDGTGVYEACCDCVEDICEPVITPEGLRCSGLGCSVSGEDCEQKCLQFDPTTGQSTVAECECRDSFGCHAEEAPTSFDLCIRPDNGTGTITLPPIGCDYLSPQEVHKIVDGLPPGTTIELDPIHMDFFCSGMPHPGCSMGLPPGECEALGGSLGGHGDCFESTLDLTVRGTGELAGFNRHLAVPIFAEVHTASRNPGDPVQSFASDMFRLDGELFGDPDFCTLRVTGGTDYGLPSPGHTTLTQLPDGTYAVDSFFDITYQIEFEGCPGSNPLDGYAGTTTATIRMRTGPEEPVCVGPCPPGTICDKTVITNPDGTRDVCCNCAYRDPDPHDTVPGPGNTYTSFGNDIIPPLPADFFEPGSEPFEGQIAFEGVPIDEALHGSASTLIVRSGDPVLPADPVDLEGTVAVELVALSLQSVAPITVTYSGGQPPENWDVAVTLSDTPAGQGSLTAIKTHCNGGTFDMTLPVNPKLTFTKVSDPGTFAVLDAPAEGEPALQLSAVEVPWVHSLWDLAVSIVAPYDGTFVPGVEEIPGCSGPSSPRPGGVARPGSFQIARDALTKLGRPGDRAAPMALNVNEVLGGLREVMQGGDTCATAVEIAAAPPILLTGTTTAYTDDYDEVCDWPDSTSPDVVYKYNPPYNMSVDVKLCNSSYDTKLYIYQGSCPGVLVGCNDDACGISDGFKSQLLDVNLSAGTTYYVIIDGYDGQSGNYELEITTASPWCPPGSMYSAPPGGSWLAGSEASQGVLRYESFSAVPEPICDLHWWGVNIVYPDECIENPMPFEIKFYQDADGMPGAEVCSYTVDATGTPVGNIGFVLYQYDILLDPCCDLTEGWVSIQGGGDPNCHFYWRSSEVGDGVHCYDSGSGIVCDAETDVSMCLTHPLQRVVPLHLGDPQAYTWHTVVPPPGPEPIGACCFGGVYASCVVTTQADCEQNLLGHFQGAGTTCSSTQACCDPGTGECIDADALCCVNELAGVPDPSGATCTAAEACCFPDDTCQMLDPLCCDDLGGVP